MDPSPEDLRELFHKQKITEVIMTYCRAIDHMDEALLRSVFHPDSQHEHGFKGPSSDPSASSEPGKPGDFVSFALATLSTHTRTQHQLGNIFVEIENENLAFTEAYFTAFHRMRPRSDPKAGPMAFDTEMDFWVGGRYMDRFERRHGKWKIACRKATTDWQRIESPSSMGMPDVPVHLQSHQSREDLVYHRREVLVP